MEPEQIDFLKQHFCVIFNIVLRTFNFNPHHLVANLITNNFLFYSWKSNQATGNIATNLIKEMNMIMKWQNWFIHIHTKNSCSDL